MEVNAACFKKEFERRTEDLSQKEHFRDFWYKFSGKSEREK
jgi:hypothetical protein